MSTSAAILLFRVGLLLSLMSSVVLSEQLDQVGQRLRLPPGLIGPPAPGSGLANTTLRQRVEPRAGQRKAPAAAGYIPTATAGLA